MLQFNNQLKFIAIIMVHKGLFHSKNHHKMTIKEKTDMYVGGISNSTHRENILSNYLYCVNFKVQLFLTILYHLAFQ